MRSLNNISAYDLQDQGLNTLASFASGTNMIFADQVENNSAAQQELDTLIETMQQNASSIRSVTLSDLEAFKASLWNPASAPTSPANQASTSPVSNHNRVTNAPDAIKKAAENARDAVEKAFWYGEYKKWSMLAGIPGMEPSEPGDMKDVLYQSKGFLNGFIDWLELEAAKDDTKVDTRGPQSGWWPFYGTSLAKEFPTVEAKRAYIQAMLENMTNVLNKPESIWSHMLFLSSLGIAGIIVALIVAKKTALWVLSWTFKKGVSVVWTAAKHTINQVKWSWWSQGSVDAHAVRGIEFDPKKNPLHETIDRILIRRIYKTHLEGKEVVWWTGTYPQLNLNNPSAMPSADIQMGIRSGLLGKWEYITKLNQIKGAVLSQEGLNHAQSMDLVTDIVNDTPWLMRRARARASSLMWREEYTRNTNHADRIAQAVATQHAVYTHAWETYNIPSHLARDIWAIEGHIQALQSAESDLQYHQAEASKLQSQIDELRDYGGIAPKMTQLASDRKQLAQSLWFAVRDDYSLQITQSQEYIKTLEKQIDTLTRQMSGKHWNPNISSTLNARNIELFTAQKRHSDILTLQQVTQEYLDLSKTKNRIERTHAGHAINDAYIQTIESAHTRHTGEISRLTTNIRSLQGQVDSVMARLHSVNAQIPSVLRIGSSTIEAKKITTLDEVMEAILKALAR